MNNHAKFASLLHDIEFISTVLHREEEYRSDKLLSEVIVPLEEVAAKLYEVLELLG